MTCQDHVGASGQIAPVEPETVAHRVDEVPDDHFR